MNKHDAEKLYNDNYNSLEMLFDKNIYETEKSIFNQEQQINDLKDEIKSTKKALKKYKDDKDEQLLIYLKNKKNHMSQYIENRTKTI